MDYIIEESALIRGKVRIGRGFRLAYGAVLDAGENEVQLSNNAMVLENSLIKGTPNFPVKVGQYTIFGHRARVFGATLGNFCEVGNGVSIEEGAVIGDYCIFGEGTRIPKGAVIPDNSVVIGKDYRILRKTTPEDIAMIMALRGGKAALEDPCFFTLEDIRPGAFPSIHSFRDKEPRIGASFIDPTAEIVGDVIIGDDCRILEGVKIIGDSHGPVRIGNRVTIGSDSVLHLLPDNSLVIEDDVVIGARCIVHGCTLEKNCRIEDDVILCDNSFLGEGVTVLQGSLVPQRLSVEKGQRVEGYPVK